MLSDRSHRHKCLDNLNFHSSQSGWSSRNSRRKYHIEDIYEFTVHYLITAIIGFINFEEKNNEKTLFITQQKTLELYLF